MKNKRILISLVFDHDSAICKGFTVHSGVLTLEKETATVGAIIVDTSGRSYTLEIKGFRK